MRNNFSLWQKWLGLYLLVIIECDSIHSSHIILLLYIRAWVILTVILLEIPVESKSDRRSGFYTKSGQVTGNRLHLNDVEKELLTLIRTKPILRKIITENKTSQWCCLTRLADRTLQFSLLCQIYRACMCVCMYRCPFDCSHTIQFQHVTHVTI